MEQWRLIDYGTWLAPAEGDYSSYGDYATVALRSEGQLRAELARLRRGRPALVSLVSPSQASLGIGLGRELSGSRWRRTTPELESKVALNLRPLTDKIHGFEDGGGGTGFCPEHLLPTDAVIAAAVDFYRSGGLCPGWVWWLTVV
jgi:hypothetical protein